MKIRSKLWLRKRKESNPFWEPKAMNSTKPITISIIMSIAWSPWSANLPVLKPRPMRPTSLVKKYFNMNLISPKWMVKCRHFKNRLIWHKKSNRNNKFWSVKHINWMKYYNVYQDMNNKFKGWIGIWKMLNLISKREIEKIANYKIVFLKENSWLGNSTR